MKTIILIFLMAMSLNLFSQDGWKEINIHDNGYDVYPYLLQGAACGAITSAVSYEIIFKKTKLDQNLCRLASIAIGSLSGYAFNQLIGGNDVQRMSRLYGSISASMVFNVSIGWDKKRDERRKLLMKND